MKIRYILFFKILLIQNVFGLELVSFENKPYFDNGICFANAVLQSLFQFSSFSSFAKSTQDYNLKQLHSNIENGKTVSAWPYVKSFYTFQNSITFLEDLTDNHNFGSSYFYLPKGLYDCNVVKKLNNSSKYKIIKKDIACSFKNEYNADLDFTVIPDLNLLSVAINSKDFNNFKFKDLIKLKDEQIAFNKIWPEIEGNNLTENHFKLKSIIALTGKKGSYHAISFVQKDYIWFECNDSFIFYIASLKKIFENLEEYGFVHMLMFERVEKENKILENIKKIAYGIKNFIY